MKHAFSFRRCVFLLSCTLTDIIRGVFSVFVSPVRCVLCGKPALSIPLCKSCLTLLDEEAGKALSENRRCRQCGRQLLSEQGICTTCRENPLFAGLDGVLPLFTYVLSKKKLLYSWKIARQRSLGAVFARYLAAAITARFTDAVVVPVPPRPGKIRKNGWDQIEDIALYLEYEHNIRVIRMLSRTDAQQQKKLTKEERSAHSKHAYVLDERSVRRLVKVYGTLPQHVVLLDDVITTGSTIRACASVLKNAENFKNAGIKGEVFIEKVSASSLFIVPG